MLCSSWSCGCGGDGGCRHFFLERAGGGNDLTVLSVLPFSSCMCVCVFLKCFF